MRVKIEGELEDKNNHLAYWLMMLLDNKEYTHFGGLYDHNIKQVSTFLYEVKQEKQRVPLYASINPLDSTFDWGATDGSWLDKTTARRADINVKSYRNFLFEIDVLTLEQQYKLLDHFIARNDIIATAVYSGGKSLHLIVSLSEELQVEVHTTEGVQYYKKVWESLAKFIEVEAASIGLPSKGILDEACKNPSRLTRLPTAIREDTGKEQSLEFIGSLMNRVTLSKILQDFPVSKSKIKNSESLPNDEDLTIEQFRSLCPYHLLKQLDDPTWIDIAGNYPKLFKLTMWAIDSTGISKDIFLEYLHKTVIPVMMANGYTKSRAIKPVLDAYSMKKR